MSFKIQGATGAQGGPLYARMLASGHPTLAAVRDLAKLQDKPGIRINNESIDSLVSAYRNAEGVFVHLPQAGEPDRVQQARTIVEAIKTAKPARVVISTSGMVVDQPGSNLQTPDDSALMTLIRGVAESGVSHAVVAPMLYLENLFLPMVFEPTQSEGVLRYPLGAEFPVSWSSHFDVAEVAQKLLTDHSVTGVVGIGHVPGLKGSDLSAGFSEQFGTTIRYEALNPVVFGEMIEPIIGPGTAGVVGFYQALSQAPHMVIAQDTSAQALLGLQPRTVRAWLAEMLA